MYRHNALPSKIQTQLKKRTNFIVNHKSLNQPVVNQKNKQFQSCKNSHSVIGNYFLNQKSFKQKVKSNSLHKINSKQKPKSVKSPQRRQKTLNSTMMLSTIQKSKTNNEGSKLIKLQDMIKDQRRIRQVKQFNQKTDLETQYCRNNVNINKNQNQQEIENTIVVKIFNKFKRQLQQHDQIMCQNFDEVFSKELWQSYQGQLDSKGNLNGYGILRLSGGSKFSGYFIDNKICGHGTFQSHQNFTVIGIWKENLLIQQALNTQNIHPLFNNNFN